jgi:hypothetical protein
MVGFEGLLLIQSESLCIPVSQLTCVEMNLLSIIVIVGTVYWILLHSVNNY